MPSTVAIIPARYGSSRLPGKPLLTIGQEPMIIHVYRRVSQIPGISAVAVATDDSRIADCIKRAGGQVFITDSAHESGTDRVAEAARHMKLSPDTLVVNIQGDQPLIQAGPVRRMVELLETDVAIHMATAACPLEESEAANPNRVKVVLDSKSRALYFSRSPIPFDRDGNMNARLAGPGMLRHIGIYAYRNAFLQEFVSMPVSWLESIEKLEQLRALENGFSIGVALVETSPLDVDTEEDLDAVRSIAEADDSI